MKWTAYYRSYDPFIGEFRKIYMAEKFDTKTRLVDFLTCKGFKMSGSDKNRMWAGNKHIILVKE